jgi:hypothetical protein
MVNYPLGFGGYVWVRDDQSRARSGEGGGELVVLKNSGIFTKNEFTPKGSLTDLIFPIFPNL